MLCFYFSVCSYSSHNLIFTAQTSGGLLAAVPAHVAVELITALKKAGYDSASIIGRVIKREIDSELVVLTD